MSMVIFWGGTGQARVLHEALAGTDTRVIAVFDNRDIASPFANVPIFVGESGFAEWSASYFGISPVFACVAIGGARGEDRVRRMSWLRSKGHAPLTVVHPTSFQARDAHIGSGCHLLAMSAVCSGARLGDGVIVNTGASVDHDCVVGDGVHVGPGARVAGEVIIGDHAFVGTGAVILPRTTIGAGAIIGAGAVVTKNVSAGVTVVGNPARRHYQERT